MIMIMKALIKFLVEPLYFSVPEVAFTIIFSDLVQSTKQLAGSTFVQAYNLALVGVPCLFFPFTVCLHSHEGNHIAELIRQF
jgi:hypothetical protein